ncbi:MAG: hypothetical protein E7054_00320 [Lentisphaerae bacterium]|nr:hypothetical protein [Lentisphaerota bacterium]
MNDFFKSFFITVLPEQGKRALLLLSLVALSVLLIFPGCGEFSGIEGEWAGCFRLASESAKFFDDWMPEHYNSVVFGRLLRELSRFLPEGEWLIRFPALLAALAALSGTVLLALEIFDRKNAVLAGWLMLSSYGFLYWGRIGSNAMFAAAALVWCAALFYGRKWYQPAPFRRSFDFSILLLITLILCGITAVLGITVFLIPQWISLLKKERFKISDVKWNIAGIASAVVVVVLMLYIGIYSGTPEKSWLENIDRMILFCRRIIISSWHEFITPDGRNGVKQFLHLFRLLLPWSLFVPATVYSLWKKRRELPEELKNIIYGIGAFILLIGIFPARRWGSMLPLLGPAMIVVSSGLSARYRNVRWVQFSEFIVRSIFMIIAALAAALLCTWPLWGKLLDLPVPVLLMIISTVTGLAALMVLAFCTVPGNFAEIIIKRPAPLAGTVFAGVILSVLINCVVLPQMSLFRTERNFWNDAADELEQCDPAPEIIMFYRSTLSGKALYYLMPKQRIVEINTPAEAEKLLRDTGGKVAVITRHRPEFLAELEKIAKANRKNFFADRPLCSEKLPVAFAANDAGALDKCRGLWLFEL